MHITKLEATFSLKNGFIILHCINIMLSLAVIFSDTESLFLKYEFLRHFQIQPEGFLSLGTIYSESNSWFSPGIAVETTYLKHPEIKMHELTLCQPMLFIFAVSIVFFKNCICHLSTKDYFLSINFYLYPRAEKATATAW